MRSFFWVVILLVGYGPSSWAQWNPQLQERFLALTPKYASLDTAGLGTFWGGWKRWFHFPHNQGDIEQWDSPLFGNGPLKYYFSRQKARAPLFVFIPGIFGEAQGTLMPYQIDMLEAYGGHVLILPDIISPSYVGALPLYDKDIIAHAVTVAEGVLQQVLNRLGADVSDIHLVAESLGSAVASAWSAQDAQDKQRFNSLTLLWPPMRLPAAMHNFDHVIDQHRPFVDHCPMPGILWTLFTGFVLHDVPPSLSAGEKHCFGARALVTGFLKGAGKTYNAYTEAAHIPAYAPKGFEDFFRHYRPEFWELLSHNDPRLDLAHWMRQIRQHRRFPLRILTSRNDFLNHGLSWETFLRETGLSNDHLLILPWGGHSGPFGMDEFPELLRASFAGP